MPYLVFGNADRQKQTEELMYQLAPISLEEFCEACGLNGIKTLEDMKKPEKWKTTWFSQWEPAEKSTQYAHDCYVLHFGTCLDENGNDRVETH